VIRRAAPLVAGLALPLAGSVLAFRAFDTPGSATCGTKPDAARFSWDPPPVIEREEVVALRFNVSDIAATVSRIERLLEEEDDGEEEADGR
jgi:hypothetical protein